MGGKAQQKTFGGGKIPSERPSKVCAACGRPFAWRKKWERDWEHVRYCSDRCRAAGSPSAGGPTKTVGRTRG